MRRILHVIGKMDRAGAETLIMNIYRTIDRSKIQFDFMVFTDEQADYDEEIEQLGGVIYHMPSFKGYNYLSLNNCFRKFFQKHSYDIVHGHIGSLAPLYLKWAKRYGAYTIAHSHNTKSQRFWQSKIYYLLSHRVIHIADFFMACSIQAGDDRFGKVITDKQNFKVINNGINVEQYKYSEERHRRLKKEFGMSDKMVFGHVGRFSQQKNHQFLIDIFYEIQKKQDNAVLILVGRGNLEEEVRKQISNLGIEKKVLLLGVRKDIPDLMNLFDAFIFPSFFEGFGIVGIEAQATGLPCFFSDGIVKEAVVTDNVYVYSLKLEASIWARNILKELKGFRREDKSKRVRDAGFDIKNTSEEIEKFYLSVESEKGNL